MSFATVEALQTFELDRVLNEDPVTRSLAVFGTLLDSNDHHVRLPAIIRLEKTALSNDISNLLHSDNLTDLKQIGKTDIYSWLFGWFGGKHELPDVKIDIICPATEVHIRKFTKQNIRLMRETPDIYDRIVKPYIQAFPPSRTQWVEDIFSGQSESEKILFRDVSTDGFIILPDMKWDLMTISSLYLLAISMDRSIRSLRDLRKSHLGMLRNIRLQAQRIVQTKWGLPKGAVRMYIHYQPSYYHFHVHIVNANSSGILGMTVGQAHLLDDIISMLECDADHGPFILERMTFTYGVGDQHGLFKPMLAAQMEIEP